MSEITETLPRGLSVVPASPEAKPRRPRTWSSRDFVQLSVSALAAAAGTAALHAVMDWRSLVGAAIWWLIIFVAIYRVQVAAADGPIVATDRVMTVLLVAGASVAIAILVWLISYVVAKGLPALRLSFFTTDLSDVGPLDAGGGALHSIIGTLEQVGIAMLFSVPIGIMTAVYLHELGGRAAPLVRYFMDAMSGLPSIVAGLLVYTVWIVAAGGGFSGGAASAALFVLMLPTVTRTAEEVLRTVPDGLRESALALGAPQWRMVTRVVLPTARSGMTTAAILGVARAVGETAPVLLTAFGASKVNVNPLSQPQSDLPLFVWGLIRQPNQTQIERAWTGALVLVLMVLVLFLIARFVGEGGRRRRRRR